MSSNATLATFYPGQEGHRLVRTWGEDVPRVFRSASNAYGYEERWVCECGAAGKFGNSSTSKLARAHSKHVDSQG